MREIADVSGLTDHRFGDPVIHGGIRTCGPRPEIVTANAQWTGARSTRDHLGAMSALPGGAQGF